MALAIPQLATAATLTSTSMSLSDTRPYSATGPVADSVSYTFTGSSVTTGTGIKCIKEVFSSSSNPGSPTLPTGMVTTSATWNAGGTNYVPQSAGTWSLNNSTNGSLFLHNATAENPASASARTVKFDAIRNSTTTDTGLYVFFTTWTGDFASGDCTGSQVDNVTIQYVLTNGQLLSLTVDGALTFTVTGITTGGSNDCGSSLTTTVSATNTTIPFGTVIAGTDPVACQRLNVGTNATNGFTVYIRDTGQLKNALNQTLADWTGTNASPTTWGATGTEAYAYTTDDGTLGTGTTTRFASGPKYAAYAHGTDETANKEIAFSSAPTTSSAGQFFIGHKVGITATTHPGTYTTTVVYTCTPIY
jgi:hypothetical protein